MTTSAQSSLLHNNGVVLLSWDPCTVLLGEAAVCNVPMRAPCCKGLSLLKQLSGVVLWVHGP